MVLGCVRRRQGFTQCAVTGQPDSRLREAAEAEAHLDRVDARIRSGQSRVRNVHETDFGAPVVIAAQKVHAQRAAGREIYARGTGRCLFGGEERAAADIYVGSNLATRHKIPLQSKGIQAEAVGVLWTLGHQKYGHDVDSILKSTAQRTRADRIGQYPAVSQSDVPDAAVRCAAVDAVAASGPDL